MIGNFNQTIEYWVAELNQYEFIQLCTRPSPVNWSLGQVGMHIIESTRYFLEQAKICISSDDHANEEASREAKSMFRNNEFPDELLEGPSTNATTPQPASKEQLINDLLNLKAEINTMAIRISESSYKGKTKHPGLNYFNAIEWLQFADMHFRHHLRQKKRIDGFLKNHR